MTSIIYHPKRDDDGKLVRLHHPSKPTPVSHWLAADAVASVVPAGGLPPGINGIPFMEWADVPSNKHDWNVVPGQAIIDEPAFCPPKGKREAAGVVIVEPDGRVWLVAPSNGYAGYTATFPKGTVAPGVNRQATAIREAYEESGLQVEITGYFADSVRSQSYTRYYLARRLGGNPASMGWETQAVHLVPRKHLTEFLTNKNDQPLLEALLAYLPSTSHQ